MTTTTARVTLSADIDPAEAAATWLSGAYILLQTGDQLAEALHALATCFAGGPDLADLTVSVTIQPRDHTVVDAIAAHLGVEAVTEEYPGRSFHRKVELGRHVSAFAACPAPVEVQREVLLEQLAELDRQAAAESAAVAVTR